MTDKELIKTIKSNSFKIKKKLGGTVESQLLREIRSHVFIPKQKIGVIRAWFDNFHKIELTQKELDILKKIIVKPKSSNWSIISILISNQKQWDEDELLKWFNYINETDQHSVSEKIITDTRIKSSSFKIKMFKKLIDDFNPNFQKSAMRLLNDSLKNGQRGFWEDCFDYMMKKINSEDNSITRELGRFWNDNLNYLTTYAEHRKAVSFIMYEATKREFFLPEVAIDTFLF